MDVGNFFFYFSKAFDCPTLDSKIPVRFLQIQDIVSIIQISHAMKTTELTVVGYTTS